MFLTIRHTFHVENIWLAKYLKSYYFFQHHCLGRFVSSKTTVKQFFTIIKIIFFPEQMNEMFRKIRVKKFCFPPQLSREQTFDLCLWMWSVALNAISTVITCWSTCPPAQWPVTFGEETLQKNNYIPSPLKLFQFHRGFCFPPIKPSWSFQLIKWTGIIIFNSNLYEASTEIDLCGQL